MNDKEEIELAFKMLATHGVPKERARYVANGIGVLVTRMDKELTSVRYILNECRPYISIMAERAAKERGDEDVAATSRYLDGLLARIDATIKPVQLNNCTHCDGTGRVTRIDKTYSGNVITSVEICLYCQGM